MRIKTIIILLITILITVVIMQNTEKVWFTFLFTSFHISKLFMMLFVAIAGFILGWLAGRPKRVRKLGGDFTGPDSNKSGPGTLSEDDREYIN